MEFFARQARARRQTRSLLAAFVVAVIGVVLALDLAIFALVGGRDEYGTFVGPLEFARNYPGFAIWCTIIVLAVILLTSVFRSLELRTGGGGAVARSLGGTRIDTGTQDPAHRRLRNVIEEMAIASGVPMPEIYVLEQENAVNAFAAGHSPANAAIAVTQGAIERLNRDELQGVIAHEFSHVLNGDMRLNVHLLGWLAGLFVAAVFGRTLLRVGSRSRKGGVPVLLAALAFMVIGYVGLTAGRILQAAVSRERERLADASAVQFTRETLGLKGALLKIAGLAGGRRDGGSRLDAARTDQVAHMLFASGVRRFLFATHPPLAERIKALDPRFDPAQLERLGTQALAAPTPPAEQDPVAALASVADAGTATPSATEIAAQVGHPETVHVRHARAIRLALPPFVHDCARSANGARSLMLALLLSRAGEVRDKQLLLVATTIGAAARDEVTVRAEQAGRLAPMLRLPAVLQLFPALRRLPRSERDNLHTLITAMSTSDQHIDAFEFCLGELVAASLRDELEGREPHGRGTLADADAPLQVLFATLAHFGATDERAARQAYELGMATVLPRERPEYALWSDWPERLHVALQRLARLQPFAKEALVQGLAKTVAHDGTMNVAEAELLRTVCAVLQCPLPPLLPQVSERAVALAPHPEPDDQRLSPSF